MTFGSLFAGIGGFDLGFERAGLTCRWQAERDPFCLAVLAQHWPHVRRYTDVADVGADAEPVDVICGGFPCQPVSLAGAGRGVHDARWLWPEFARVVRAVRPRYVVVENVPGLFVRGFDTVLGDLVTSGYDAEWDCIPAAAVGAPHLRDRILIVAALADADSRRCEGQRLAEPAGLEGTRRRVLDRRGPVRELDDAPHGADASGSRLPLSERAFLFGARGTEEGRAIAQCDWWAVEPDMGRVAYGVPGRVDRLRALGNAIVPQVAEWIGRRLMEVEQ